MDPISCPKASKTGAYNGRALRRKLSQALVFTVVHTVDDEVYIYIYIYIYTHMSCITIRTLNHGNDGICLIMDHAGFYIIKRSIAIYPTRLG